MRIHQLEIEAFGPFAGHESVDFDALGAQGLFLLNGPTGSGKTTVLDAICFALYGSVPGERGGSATRLRSDHAAPSVAPRVCCEFSVGGRRYRVERSPEWRRPSRRDAAKLVSEKGRVSLEAFEDGQWVARSTRFDEVGAEIETLLGMNRDQFTRVVMLPQGEFARFLQAKPAERQELLQKLFDTGRFASLEQELTRRAQEQASALAGEQNQLDEIERSMRATWDELPVALEGAEDEKHEEDTQDDPGALDDPDALAPLDALVEGASQRVSTGAAECKRSHTRAAQLAGELQEALEKKRRHDRYEQMLELERDLDSGRAEFEAKVAQIETYRRALSVRAELTGAERAAKRLDVAQQQAADSEAVLRAAGDTTAPEQLPEEVERLGEQLTLLRAELDVQDELNAALREEAQAQQSLERSVLDAQRHADQAEVVTQSIAPAQERLRTAQRLAGTVDQAAAELASARTVSGAVERRDQLQTEREGMQATASSARTRALDLRTHWLDIVERRLTHAAYELAQTLTDGQSCPVCGSVDHPSPATGDGEQSPSAADAEQARQDYDDAEAHATELGRQLAAHDEQLTGQRAIAGAATAEDAQERVRLAEQAQAHAVAAQTDCEQTSTQIEVLEQQVADHRAASQRAEQNAASSRTRVEHAGRRVKQLRGRLERARGDYAGLPERIDAVGQRKARLEAWRQARSDVEAARRSHDEAQTALGAALAEHGFETARAVHDALLESDVAQGLDGSIESYRAQRIRCEQLRSEPDVELAAQEGAAAVQSGTAPAPSQEQLQALEGTLAQAHATEREDSIRQHLLERGLKKLRERSCERHELIERIGRAREQADVIASLAETVRGAGENEYRMSLSSYVLAARLEQVAEAASERLVRMSDGRYTLAHSDERAKHGARSGLSLVVVDGWTGVSRQTSTLSGGESFMASLALALGLADVVQQESGGLDIETLFVDEGFGSLDEESLEDVMDALESLRDHGRVVGLVSHVGEMKQRIPVQLDVLKSRNGSRLALRSQPAA